MYTYEIIADNGVGEQRTVVERRSDGAICLTTNAETREPVTPEAYSGPGWDTQDVAEWLDELEIQFGDRDAAEAFVLATGRELPETAE